MSDRERQNRWLIGGIIAAVLVWGLILAIGAAFHSAGLNNFDPRRGLILFGCVAAFLGFWVLMLFSQRRKRTERRDEE